MNERKTEDMVSVRLQRRGYYDDNSIVVEKQKSDTPRIRKLLRNASKSGSGSGKPEFIIHSTTTSDLLVVIECKADPSFHDSGTRIKYREYAVDGVLLYSSFLSREYDVIAIAVSGQNDQTIRISQFIHVRGAAQAEPWDIGDEIQTFDDYRTAFLNSDIKFRQDYSSLLYYNRALNDQLQARKITESQRAFLISGILIALKNQAFRKSYMSHRTGAQLTSSILETIRAEFEDVDLPTDRSAALIQSFSFLQTLPADKSFIESLIGGIDENVNSFMETHKYYDTVGQFYVEFLRYANNDKGLGIVLTPPHIAELFALLAEVNKNSVVFDNCCGTAGLLIAAMKQMIKDAGASTKLQTRIRTQQLFGVEYQPNIYALSVCNMILHGDGKTNINRGDCFQSGSAVFIGNGVQRGLQPSVGLLNPPYKNKRMPDDKEELEFVINNIDHLQEGGRCISIVPITCATSPSGAIGDLKRRLLEKHTLEGVMSMPIELFHNSKTNVVTCIMVFTAQRPHPKGKKTWFGYWRDDGFIKTKHRGRADAEGRWPENRDRWVQAFRNRDVGAFSVMEEVSYSDEWCAEAYLSTDYDAIGESALNSFSVRYFVSEAFSRLSR